MSTFLYILAGCAALFLFFYFILPGRIRIHYGSNLVRSLIFFGIAGYLAYDFYMKGKYGFIVVLAMGSVAFVYMIRSLGRK